MKRLDKEFKSCGFYFKQVKRDGNIAIYEKRGITSDRPGWEIIRIGSHNGYNLGGNYIKPAETYPCNSMWGTNGFTSTTREAAEITFNELKSGVKEEVKLSIKPRASRKKGSKQPFLTCLVTCESRPTTLKYLETKAKKHNVTVPVIRDHYISKPALKLLKQGMSVTEARKLLGINNKKKISSNVLQKALELNGRKQNEKALTVG